MTDPLRPPDTDAEPCSCETGWPDDYPARRRMAGLILAACFAGLVVIALVAWWAR